MPNNDLARKLAVEFIGAFTLTFAGAGAIIATQGQNLVAIALAHGLAIGLMIQAAGHISGGHYNPAVTMRQKIAEKYPSIATVTKPISDALTSEVITELNAKVDVDGKEPADVARDWLVSKGFVQK